MASNTVSTPAPPLSEHAKSFPWAQLAWFSILLILAYLPVLQRLVNQWMHDEDMGHGFFVPVISAYIIWRNRERILAVKPKPSYMGLLLIAWGAAQLLVATLGVELFLARTAFLISLLGVVVVLGGLPIVRALAFPLFLLIFMVPIPAIVYNQITFPLQLFASQVAEFALGLIGIPVIRDGNVLELPSQKLSVVDACSGIRSLLSLSYLSLVYGYIFDDKPWVKWVLLAGTVPIAIAANAGRVTLNGILSEINPELVQGAFHTASGWMVFVVALGLLVLLHSAVNWVYRLATRSKAS